LSGRFASTSHPLRASATPTPPPRRQKLEAGTGGDRDFEVVRNILANGYAGGIYPVNPKGDKILGLKVYPSIDALPEGIELAIIILPAESCPQALSECTRKGITHFVLSAGGFAEVDEPRAQIQQDLLRIIRETGASLSASAVTSLSDFNKPDRSCAKSRTYHLLLTRKKSA